MKKLLTAVLLALAGCGGSSDSAPLDFRWDPTVDYEVTPKSVTCEDTVFAWPDYIGADCEWHCAFFRGQWNSVDLASVYTEPDGFSEEITTGPCRR